ncbi:hypothetical protein [uncultured Desulfuromusa sp.]|uniref:hypothetical protein n=1 Tax=uncultured Desulfuromusa sp. TaxID=219183 RepID=UPI002AA7C52A|nr:hypothetical protein [uncultured Desulfuromusa sp.]
MTHDDRQFMQQLFETQTQQFQHHLSAVAESFDHKLGLIADGHEVLRNEIRETRTELKQEIELCNFKIDAVAGELKAHRADTEAHHGVYRVKES